MNVDSSANRPSIIAVAGAKGGAGASLIASSVAVYLSTLGRRVLAVDADRRGGNLHMFLGAEYPGGLPQAISLDRSTPSRGEARAVTAASELDPSPTERLVDTEVPGLQLAHGGIDVPHRGKADCNTHTNLRQRLSRVDADFVVVDLGAGLDRSTGEFWTSADHRLFVLTPDAGAVESMYRAVRVAFAASLRRFVDDAELWKKIEGTLKEAGGSPIPLDLLQFAEQEHPEFELVIRTAMDDFDFPFIVNQASLRSDIELGSALVTAALKRYGVMLTDRGHIEEDNAVAFAAKRMRPLLLESPGAKASRAMEKIARRMMTREGRRVTLRPINQVPVGTHHDWLGVDRFASDEEIRRGYKRNVAVFDPKSIAQCGLFTPSDLAQVRRRLDEAHEVLLDARRRERYEDEAFPTKRPHVDEVDAVITPRSSPAPAPDIEATTEHSGSFLQAVRRSRGVTLSEISGRTKVGTSYLISIEAEDFGQLPAPVYVRGFVAEFAKMLELDPEQTSRGYLRRYEQYLEQTGRDIK